VTTARACALERKYLRAQHWFWPRGGFSNGEQPEIGIGEQSGAEETAVFYEEETIRMRSLKGGTAVRKKYQNQGLLK
jgi:hypothetical protein